VGRAGQFDANSDGRLEKAEFVTLVSDLRDQGPRDRFIARDYLDLDMGCCALDCVPWGTRKVSMDRQDIVIEGFHGPCSVTVLSTQLSHSIETSKARWIHTVVGAVQRGRWRAYVCEALLLTCVAFMAIIVGWHEYDGQDVTGRDDSSNEFRSWSAVNWLAPLIGLSWLLLRVTVFLRRRRGQAMLYALGTASTFGRDFLPGVGNGRFPVLARQSESVVDGFLACKGVGDLPTAETAESHFEHAQQTALCRRVRHVFMVGPNFYKLSKAPDLKSLGNGAAGAAARQFGTVEHLAGYTKDVAWVHTWKLGHDPARLLRYQAWSILGGALSATLLAAARVAIAWIHNEEVSHHWSAHDYGSNEEVRFWLWVWVGWVVIGAASGAAATGWWWWFVPARAEFGFGGMSALYGSQLRHPAKFYIAGEDLPARQKLALSIMTAKLGRVPSDRVIRSWQCVTRALPCLRAACIVSSRVLSTSDTEICLP
jgi:hypothetical protein